MAQPHRRSRGGSHGLSNDTGSHLKADTLNTLMSKATEELWETRTAAGQTLASRSTFSDDWVPEGTYKATVERDGYDDDWPLCRRLLGRVFSSTTFDVTLCLVILVNMGLLVADTDHQATHNASADWMTLGNYIVIIFYVIEISLRLYVYRFEFFMSLTNWADFCVIMSDVAVESVIFIAGDSDTATPIVVFRVFRILRLGRTHRALVLFPELNIMVKGLAGAFKAMFWGMILLLVFLTVWAILAVQIIHPFVQDINCEECSYAFETVPKAMLTFTQQIIAGDSWGRVSVPIIEYYPIMYLFFFGALVSMGMAILNLILAVVIDSAALARKETDREIAKSKEDRCRMISKNLYEVCAGLDTNNNGSLSYKELMSGYRKFPAFRDAMTVLDISESDMKTVFKILDQDSSGDVDYAEFVHQLYKMKADDSHTLLVFIRYYINEVRQKMNEEMGMIKNLIKSEKQMHRELRSMTSLFGANSSQDRLPAIASQEVASSPHLQLKKGMSKTEVDLQQIRECSGGSPLLLQSASSGANGTPFEQTTAYQSNNSSAPSQFGGSSVDQWCPIASDGQSTPESVGKAIDLNSLVVCEGVAASDCEREEGLHISAI